MKEYFKNSAVTLYCGDCFEIMNNLNLKVNFILTDIPYVISKKNNFNTMGRNGIDFGEWDKDFNLEGLCILKKCLLSNGSIVVFHSFEQYSELKYILESNGLECKDRIIWEKTNPMPRNRERRYISNCELGSWYINKDEGWTFNRQNDKYELMVMSYPTESASIKRYHPTQKNLKLFEKIIKIHSNKDDLVLDPFAGAGTTGIACMNLDRNCILIEKEEKYCEIIACRLSNYFIQGELL